jgi:hypothetical protein
MRRWSPFLVLLALLPLIGWAIGWIDTDRFTTAHTSETDRRSPSPPPERTDLKVKASPVKEPVLLSVEEAPIFDEEIVIGLLVGDEPRAYLRSAFDYGPPAHVVYDRLGPLAYAVTHCDINRCTRVLAAPDEEELDVCVGGWEMRDRSMILLVDGKRYLQSSPDIPLADVPHVETTWGLWRELYPETQVYVTPYGQSYLPSMN